MFVILGGDRMSGVVEVGGERELRSGAISKSSATALDIGGKESKQAAASQVTVPLNEAMFGSEGVGGNRWGDSLVVVV